MTARTTPTPAAAWTAEADRLRTVVRRAATRPVLRAAARARPDEARAVVAELRTLLDEVEADSGGLAVLGHDLGDSRVMGGLPPRAEWGRLVL